MKADTARCAEVCSRHPTIPKSKRYAHEFWKFVTGAVFVGGLIYSYWGGWYWAIGGIALAFVMVKAVNRSAAEFVMETAKENPMFREEMIARGVIVE